MRRGLVCGMKPIRLSEVCEFLPGKFRPALVYGSGRMRAFVLCLEPGQGMEPRADSEEMVCYVLEGRGRLRIGEDEYEVSAGDFAGVAGGEVRGVEAEERMTVLWVHVSAAKGCDG